jgi:hypothetical protein
MHLLLEKDDDRPDHDMIMAGDLEALAAQLKISPMEKYALMCRMLSDKIKIRNR